MVIQKRIFKHYPESSEVIDHLISKTEKKLNDLEESKSIGLKFWNETKFAQYDRDRYNQKELLNSLKDLKKEIDYHDMLHDVGMEMSGQMDIDPDF